MKKLAALINSALLTLASATPALAQSGGSIGFEKPEEAQITDIGKLINSGVGFVIIISGLLVFIFLVWGGIEWLTSGGDKGKVEAARNRIVNALIGIAIIAAAWALTRIIAYFFGVEGGLSTFSVPRPY